MFGLRMNADKRKWGFAFIRVYSRQDSRENRQMDYVIAGIASLGLFIYLLYALLRPERF